MCKSIRPFVEGRASVLPSRPRKGETGRHQVSRFLSRMYFYWQLKCSYLQFVCCKSDVMISIGILYEEMRACLTPHFHPGQYHQDSCTFQPFLHLKSKTKNLKFYMIIMSLQTPCRRYFQVVPRRNHATFAPNLQRVLCRPDLTLQYTFLQTS